MFVRYGRPKKQEARFWKIKICPTKAFKTGDAILWYDYIGQQWFVIVPGSVFLMEMEMQMLMEIVINGIMNSFYPKLFHAVFPSLLAL